MPVQKGKAPRESSCPWSHLHLELGIKTAAARRAPPQICVCYFDTSFSFRLNFEKSRYEI
jgi:hypothetical protein